MKILIRLCECAKVGFLTLWLSSIRELCIIYSVAKEVLDEPGLRSVKQITRDCVFFFKLFCIFLTVIRLVLCDLKLESSR